MLLHELAMIQGNIHADGIKNELSGWELARWQSFFEAREKRRDKIEIYLARLTYFVANMWGENMDADDVFIKWDESAPTKVNEEDLMMALAHGLGAKIIDNRKKQDGN